MTVGKLKLQGFLVILGATVVGVAGGVMLERARSDEATRSRWADEQRPPREGFGLGRRGRFPRAFETLDLTQEQRDRIDSIFQAWQPRTEAMMDELLPRFQALRDSVRRHVDAVLTPEQLEKLRESIPPDAHDGLNPLRPRRPRNGSRRSPPDR